jgi:16S rRNA (guanine527-N7)-methyltransferase
MGSELPDLSREEFADRLLEVEGREPELVDCLHVHYLEMRRWNKRLSLVGPGTADHLVERHYGESLAALDLLPPGPGTLVDVGSGAGFPGWVLAAARRDLEATLVEPRKRKCTFLRSAARRARLPCRCLDARVALPLPEGLPAQVDVVTLRALGGVPEILIALLPRLALDASILVWRGREPVSWPDPFEASRRIPLAGSRDRWIEEARLRCPEDDEFKR